MPGRLQGKVAVITGNSTGIGRATSLTFQREGATIVCSDLKEEAPDGSSTRALIEQAGGKAIFVPCNVTKPSEVENLMDTAIKEYGRIDILVCNAGIHGFSKEHGPGPIWEIDHSAWEASMSVNVYGVVHTLKYAIRHMIKQDPAADGKRGRIINLASIYGLVASTGASPYIAAKHAVSGLTKATALELAPHKIHCNAVSPGFTDTAFIAGQKDDIALWESINSKHPLGGIGQAQDIANMILFMASEENTWMSGAVVPVDGGYTAQ
ncbi:NAD(P)-binding protein [Eremomyces bilateralis CBS 781.70]|uniref:NAD(P)-binding protein n=1 Tax=Eremomyces bilateralis CBS 781.70 TaxID=1392243 RepID=A0A6G1G0Z1_9PEZI|nr:NAD(P)-binding protein [Eremomyces bilateralis CBS 781.70]KAF1811652.1 NAD(P)-binding protein [Eremomyces bilateralis CBS 781.70]